MYPNNYGYDMGIFFMLCSKDYQKGHETIALKLT